MAREVALTTTDNPFDPFDEYDKWWNFDVNEKGYCTDSYIARVMKTSSELPETEQSSDWENAINEILRYNVLGNYKKVVRNT